MRQVCWWVAIGCCGVMLAVTSVAAEQSPSVERVFGPEVATGPYKHPACLTALENGDLYLVYYGGQGEYARDTAVFGSRRPKGHATWTPPQVIARDPFRSLGNGVVWQAPRGPLRGSRQRSRATTRPPGLTPSCCTKARA
jgi:hypothetical protein